MSQPSSTARHAAARRRSSVGRYLLIGLTVMLGLLVVSWALGRAFLEVQISPHQPPAASPEPAPGATLREVYETLQAAGNGTPELRLLEGNVEAWVARWRLIASAERRLDVNYFILKPDVFGAAFLGHLQHKAQQGVQVRVMLDGMGVRMSGIRGFNGYLDALADTPNLEARMYRPLRTRMLDMFLTLNPAALAAGEHAKLLLADDLHGLTGGRNISDEYFAPPQDNPLTFRDTDVRLSGRDTAASLRRVFEARYEAPESRGVVRRQLADHDDGPALRLAYLAMDAWLHDAPLPAAVRAEIERLGLPWLKELEAMPTLRGAAALPPTGVTRAEVRLLDSGTRLLQGDDPVNRDLARLVGAAQQDVFIQSPYLILPDRAVEVLAEAAERGVRIVLYTNGPTSTDLPLTQALFLERWPELLARVPTLRLYVAGDRRNVHGKLAVIDGELLLVGTYNLDPISMALNSELIAAVWSRELSALVIGARRALLAGEGGNVREYRIARHPDGTPQRDARGRVLIAAGSDEHVEAPPAVGRYRAMLRAVQTMPGNLPFYLSGPGPGPLARQEAAAD
ncbi:phosphatidylserine/phosphatidylglycerophosphate/cardiolipin synthase family protein [Ectothiorhodospiraceae bacterium 2226]|nr:phosphatidylserine/phosphatidylglycerophosphate/cardiolipin synthase family protein [Ectothiorhodospiraceae bacterium 2226]